MDIFNLYLINIATNFEMINMVISNADKTISNMIQMKSHWTFWLHCRKYPKIFFFMQKNYQIVTSNLKDFWVCWENAFEEWDKLKLMNYLQTLIFN